VSDFKAKMYQNPISAGAPPQTVGGGAYGAPANLLPGFKGPTSTGREGSVVESRNILKIDPAAQSSQTAAYTCTR